MIINNISIPSWLMDISYNGRIIPNGTTHNMAKTGANCQVFAFYLLRSHDLIVPEYRSSELWADTEFSTLISDNFQPLDMLFFHKTPNSYGAHVAVYIGNNQAIHLSKQEGKPVIWEMDVFFQCPKYQFLLGGKRFFNKKLSDNYS